MDIPVDRLPLCCARSGIRVIRCRLGNWSLRELELRRNGLTERGLVAQWLSEKLPISMLCVQVPSRVKLFECLVWIWLICDITLSPFFSVDT